MFVPGYRHFLRRADSLLWDEQAIELTADAAAWPELPSPLRIRLLRLLAGFCVGEEQVARELAPFADAADGEVIAACFRVQQRDEARHARFFDRVAREVVGVCGVSAAERRQRLREHCSPAFLELFEHRLPAAARSLPGRGEALASAVALYHLLLEGLVFTAGQLAWLELLEGRAGLAGLRRGVELVIRDERWHIGFGTRLLDELRRDPAVIDAIVDDGASALSAWSDAVPSEIRDRVLAIHRRRVDVAGLIAPRAAQQRRAIAGSSSRANAQPRPARLGSSSLRADGRPPR